MNQYVYRLLGSVLPKKLLIKWSKSPIGSFKFDVADYAPSKRGVM